MERYGLLLSNDEGNLRNEYVDADSGGVWFNHKNGVISFKHYEKGEGMKVVASFPIRHVQMVWKERN